MSHDPASDCGLHPVDLLDGRFRIAATIGQSEVATIYRARDLADHHEFVAVKVPFPRFESSAVWYARFRREEEVGLRLNHPGVMRCVPVSAPRSRVYLVTEYVPGQTLADRMTGRRPLPEAEALRIAAEVGAALQYLHEEGLIHRDLKPSGIRLGEDGTVRISDFGLAAAPSRRRRWFARWQTPFGVPSYLAPEQVENGPIDERTDVYRLGIILYEMLTGEVPYARHDPWASAYARLQEEPRDIRELNDRISPAAEGIVRRALQRRPEDRYPTAAAFRGDLLNPTGIRACEFRYRGRPSAFPAASLASPVTAGIMLGSGGLAMLAGLFGLLWLLFQR